MASALLVIGRDDDRKVYTTYLRREQLIVHAFATPRLALAAFDTGLTADVVVTDDLFPRTDLDAVAFVRELRARVDPGTSIIVVAGLMREEDREPFRAAGADFSLLKPARPSEVLYEVKRALR